ncbi:histidine kinase osmosensor [Mortierella polycephala]|uniref:Histidine kinase osmosensor n=1 Tax=Mortierella polycephala TaxID=41804 RepID=A0A9P6PPX0_9FUNG|nr:histidine kinase osmosensor [Mortierella polycephala]
MAANLTTQVRDIDSLSTAVANADYTESITVEAAGEIDSLKAKAKVNQTVYSLRESIQKNIAAREAAELSARSKTELLVNMSHELRGPMNDIIGMTHQTLETELTPQQRENLMIVSNTAHSLLKTIDGLQSDLSN